MTVVDLLLDYFQDCVELKTSSMSKLVVMTVALFGKKQSALGKFGSFRCKLIFIYTHPVVLFN